MKPLDVKNWLEWKHQFQILLASQDYLEEATKLTLFLDNLGPDGRTLAFKLFPQLANFGSTSTDSVTFAEVWWQFNEYFWLKKRHQSDLEKNFFEDKKKLQLILDQDMEEAQHPTLLRLIPILSMCELESVSKRIPRLERVVRNFSQLFGVQIEPCCLKNHRIGRDESIYIINGFIVSSLTLINIPEAGARKLLPFFRGIKSFGMRNMKIVDEITEFPKHLIELSLIDCKIERQLWEEWTPTFETTLRRLHMVHLESVFAYPILYKPQSLDLKLFKDLNSLTLACRNNKNFQLGANNLEFLAVLSDGWFANFLISLSPNLRHFHCDALESSTIKLPFRSAMPALKFITLGKWEDLGFVSKHAFTSVKEVEIFSEVDPKYKAEIDSMKLKVIVNYRPIPEPPQDPNLIFSMLIYDCLLEIIKYLDQSDWMSFGRLHENAEMVVATYKYPREVVYCEDFFHTGMVANDREHFLRISKLVGRLDLTENGEFTTNWGHFIGAFENLTTLCLGYLSADLYELLPCELGRLEVDYSSLVHDDSRFTSYMRRLNPTLRILKIYDLPSNEQSTESQWNWLTEPQNLEEVSIEGPIPWNVSMILLGRNWQSLERIEFTFIVLKEQGWGQHEMTLKMMSTLRHLKELSICQKGPTRNGNAIEVLLLVDLMKSVGPNLRKLSLTGDFADEEIRELFNSESFKNLEDLQVQLIWDFKAARLMLHRMTGLSTLEIMDKDSEDYDILDQDTELIPLIDSLPNLSSLRLCNYKSSFKFERDLRKHLMQANRPLRINSVQF